MAHRIPAALRVLARRRGYLAAMGAASLALLAGLLFTFALAAVWAWAVPPAWGIASWGVALALLFWLPYAFVVLAFLSLGVRAYTLATSGPPPSTPAGIAGGMAGLGVSAFGHRLAKRRGPLAWITDPWGSAAREGIVRLAPDSPLQPLIAMAEEQRRNPPTRGAWLIPIAIVLVAAAAWLTAQQLAPTLAALLVGPLVVLVVLAAVLGAALRGVLRGAWDRYMMDRMAAQAEASAYLQRGKGYEPRP